MADISTHENEWQNYYAEHRNPEYPVNVYYVDPCQMVMGEVSLHWHSEIEIDYIKSGTATYHIGEETVSVSEGSAILINGRRVHSVTSSDSNNCVILSVLFTPEYIFENSESFLAAKYQAPITDNSTFAFRLVKSSNTSGIDVINNILKTNLEKKYGYELMTKSLLCQLWLMLLENSSNQKNNVSTLSLLDEQRVKDAISYIHQNYMHEVTLEQIAESVHLSKSECCRSFKRITQMTPFEYLMRHRIFESAVKMQRNDPVCSSINTLAQSVGFNNASYYNKIFKKYLGDTPTKSKESIKRSHRDSLSPFGISISRM